MRREMLEALVFLVVVAALALAMGICSLTVPIE